MDKKTGKIVKGVGGKYTVKCGDELISARARGVFRHEQISPEVGDNVTIKGKVTSVGEVLGYSIKIDEVK